MTFTCKRCHEEKPRKGSRRSKIFGGRICAECSRYMGELMSRGRYISRPPRNVPKPEPVLARNRTSLKIRAQQLLSRVFRRRGVQ